MKKMCVLLLVVLSSILPVKPIKAQTCPAGQPKTAVIFENGIQTTEGQWKTDVKKISDDFFATYPNLQNCIVFDVSYNQSGWKIDDLGQSFFQVLLQEVLNRVYPGDPDFQTLLGKIRDYSALGYRVVLVGHSQGSLFTNGVYAAIRDKVPGAEVSTIPYLPDPSKLSIVNIGTPANKVADGYGRYTTQCGDIILSEPIVPFPLPANIIADDLGLGCNDSWSKAKHSLVESYMVKDSKTQRQIYADLLAAAQIPDPGCNGRADCLLQDSFDNADYLTNFASGEVDHTMVKEMDWALQMNASSYLVTVAGGGNGGSYTGVTPSTATLRTRRFFTGAFTASLRYAYDGSGNSTARINLVRSIDDAVISYADVYQNNYWHDLVFSRTSSTVQVTVDGTVVKTVDSLPGAGYYLRFDLKSDSSTVTTNTLKIDELLVERTPPPPPTPSMAFTPAANNLSVMQGSSNFVNLVLQSQNGLTGNASLGLWCMQTTCPTGFTYSFPTTGMLPSNGSISAKVYFFPDLSAVPGTYNYEYRATIGTQTVVSKIAVTVSLATMTLTPTNNSLPVMQGNSGYVDLVLTSQNGITGNPSLELRCVGSCPTGITYNFPTAGTLPANGTLPIRVTFNPSSIAPGTYNYQYWATLDGTTIIAKIALTVSVSNAPTMILTPVNNTVSIVRGGVGYVDLVLRSQNGMTGNPDLGLWCVASCPANFGYNFPAGSTTNLPANGSIPIRVIFGTNTSTTPGTYNFQYKAILPGTTAIANIAVTVTAPVITTGTVNVNVSGGYNGPVYCTLNNVNITAPISLANQPAGSKTLWCYPPTGYTLASITPSDTQSLLSGSTVNFFVNVTPIQEPAPVLSYLVVNSQPKVNMDINVSVFGSGFVFGAQGYICTGTATNTCTMTTAVFINSTQISLPYVRSSSPTTLYLRIGNPNSILSNYLTMVVIP